VISTSQIADEEKERRSHLTNFTVKVMPFAAGVSLMAQLTRFLDPREVIDVDVSRQGFLPARRRELLCAQKSKDNVRSV
jgi:hypothetical protein